MTHFHHVVSRAAATEQISSSGASNPAEKPRNQQTEKLCVFTEAPNSTDPKCSEMMILFEFQLQLPGSYHHVEVTRN